MILASQLIGRVSIEGAESGMAKLAGVGQASDSAGLKLAGFAAGAAVLVGAAFVLIGAKASEMAGNFQQSVVRLRTGAGDVQDSFTAISDHIKQTAIDSGVATGPLLSAMYLIMSSGQRGAQAYNTLAVAARGAQIEQAKVGDVANVLSGLMTNYGTKVFGATQHMNGLITAVQNGKITLQDLSTAMGPIDPIAQHLGISMADVAAAMTTQTNAMIPAARAATGLRFMMSALENPTHKATAEMTALGLNSVAVANEMKVSLPGALEMIVQAALKVGPEGSVPFNRAVGDMVGGIRGLSAFMALTGTHMADFVANSNRITAAMKTGGDAVLGWSTVQGNFNLQMDRAKAAFEVLGISIGQRLLPFLTNLLTLITPLIAGFANWITSTNGLRSILNQVGQAFQQVFDPVQKVQQAVKPLTDTFDRATDIFHKVWQQLGPVTDTLDRTKGAVMGVHTVLKPLTDTFDRASSVLKDVATHATTAHQAFNPFVAIFQGVATAIRITVTVFQAVSLAVRDTAGFFQAHIWPILQTIGSFLAATFVPLWTQLVNVWNNSLLPSLKQLWGALQPLLPVFAAIGGIILGVVVVALGIFVGVLGGVLKALAGLLQGVATVIAGMVQAFTGFVQVISGIIKFFVDLATGNFKNLGNDLHSIWNGIINIFGGAWKMIEGIFQGAWNAISGFVGGMVTGIIGFFTHLAATLVGHSIIPDMINAIVGWFLSLPGKALNAIGSLAGNLVSFFGGLARNALTWGLNIISNLAGGIINGIWSSLGNAMSAIGNFIHDHLPHSPAKMGPLRDLAKQGSLIPEQIAQGIMSGIPKLQPSLNLMLTPHASFTPSDSTRAGASSSPSTMQPIILQIDGYQLARILMPHVVGAIRNNLAINNL